MVEHLLMRDNYTLDASDLRRCLDKESERFSGELAQLKIVYNWYVDLIAALLSGEKLDKQDWLELRCKDEVYVGSLEEKLKEDVPINQIKKYLPSKYTVEPYWTASSKVLTAKVNLKGIELSLRARPDILVTESNPTLSKSKVYVIKVCSKISPGFIYQTFFACYLLKLRGHKIGLCFLYDFNKKSFYKKKFTKKQESNLKNHILACLENLLLETFK